LIQTSGEIALFTGFDLSQDIINHIAFEVEDIKKGFQKIILQGVKFVFDKILEGSRGSKVIFSNQMALTGFGSNWFKSIKATLLGR
jgi:hypothetical protein